VSRPRGDECSGPVRPERRFLGAGRAVLGRRHPDRQHGTVQPLAAARRRRRRRISRASKRAPGSPPGAREGCGVNAAAASDGARRLHPLPTSQPRPIQRRMNDGVGPAADAGRRGRKNFFMGGVMDLVSRRIGPRAQPVREISSGRCPMSGRFRDVLGVTSTTVLTFSILAAGLCARPAAADTFDPVFIAQLNGAQETPPTLSPSTGVAFLTFNKDTSTLCYAISYTPLAGTEFLAHFHGPAMKGDVAGPGVASPVL